MWCGVLLKELDRFGLRSGRLLDVGCGTGRAFAPMIRRGWEIQGCDLAPAMIACAETKFDGKASLAVIDVCDIPVCGSFDLVWALNDLINSLLSDGDLGRAMAGMRSNLARDGLLLFDTNSIAVYRSAFTDDGEGDVGAGERMWSGKSRGVTEGGTFEAELSGPGIPRTWSRISCWHSRQIPN
jgi:SAM-dependent methyltransferase